MLTLTGCSPTISDQLENIGYFDTVKGLEKYKYIKAEIDKRYTEDKWLVIPNDYYISSVYKLAENNNKSSTSDFRAFEVWAGDLYEQNLESYINSAKAVFEKQEFKLDWRDEKIDWKKESMSIETIHHTVWINDTEYVLYSGNVKDRSRHPAFDYLTNFRQILNKVLEKQGSDFSVVLLTAPEYVYFVLLPKKMKVDFGDIVEQTENKIEN